MAENLTILGLNHKSSPIELREVVSFDPDEKKGFLSGLKALFPECGIVLLSTCNRVELYIENRHTNVDISGFISQIASFHNVPFEELFPYMYVHAGEKAVRHLFNVACGLDSMVVGEAQILGQVKESYKLSLECGFTGKELNMVFQKALALSKKIRTNTAIGEGNVSISSIACELAEEVLGDLSDRKILLIGTGKIGKLTLKSLQERHASTILVANRTHAKARALAEEYNWMSIEFDEIENSMKDIDVVICSTFSGVRVIDLKMVKRVMKGRNNKRIFFIDLAMPRDIDPGIGAIPEVHLYNIDSLKNISNKNLAEREKELVKCRRLVDEAMEKWSSAQALKIAPRNGNIIFADRA